VEKTILICDDESSLRELVRAVLGPGYSYHEAVDGIEALEVARSLVPDLVVLDLMLPRTSGFQVLEALKDEPVLSATPILVLTAWSHLEAAARAAGADRFVAKPFEPAELAATVKELLAA
jgi:CheY-like chemotaxis protein